MATMTVEDRRERLDRLREKVPELEARAEELEVEIADATADGEDTEALKGEYRDVREDLDAHRKAAKRESERLEEAEEEHLRERADDRLRSIKRRVGGLCGEAPRRADEARELAEKLRNRLDWLAQANLRRRLLKKEAEALADRFDLEMPELKRMDENPMDTVMEVKRRVRRASAPRDSLGAGLGAEKVVGLLERIFDEDSPTDDLLKRLEALEDAEGGE